MSLTLTRPVACLVMLLWLGTSGSHGVPAYVLGETEGAVR